MEGWFNGLFQNIPLASRDPRRSSRPESGWVVGGPARRPVADPIHEVGDVCPLQGPQKSLESGWTAAVGSRLAFQFTDYEIRRKIQEIQKKGVWMYNLKFIGLYGCIGKVREIESNDGPGPAADCGSQDMTILGVACH